MEKKTIGGFISALRKANGMTQRELAQRLNVSDKTVSRWECDESAPDLSLIPVIAEIFNVTCDELIRGQRKSPEERASTPTDGQSDKKCEKEIQRLLKSTFSRYQSQSYIAMGISTLGMIVALICNLAFLSAILGFLLGLIFFLASIICQAVFMNKAFFRVEDAEIDSTSLSRYKRNVISLAEKSIGLTVFFLGFTLPLVTVDVYFGLSADSLLIWGTIGAGMFGVIYAVILRFLNNSLLKKGVYTLEEGEMKTYTHNQKLSKKLSGILVLILAVTILFHVFGIELIWSPERLSLPHAIVFDDYDSFVTYMEESNTYVSYGDNESVALPEPDSTIYDESEYIEEMTDPSGNVVCRFVWRNHNVAIIQPSQEDSLLPIKVITNTTFQIASQTSQLINALYCLLYPIEFLVFLLIYFKKKAK